MLKIRLSRTGKNKYATYRVVVMEHTRKPTGRVIETIGTYNPHSDAVEFNADRVSHWMNQGAQPSPTVHNLLVNQNLIDAEKVRVWGGAKGNEKEASKATSSENPETAEPETTS